MALLEFFLPPNTAAPGFDPTSVSRVAPDWTVYLLSYSTAASLASYKPVWAEVKLEGLN